MERKQFLDILRARQEITIHLLPRVSRQGVDVGGRKESIEFLRQDSLFMQKDEVRVPLPKKGGSCLQGLSRG